MSEPIRTSPAKRKQLAAALKRNMARRKAVASHPSPTASNSHLTSPLGEGDTRLGVSGEDISVRAAVASSRKGAA